jgi:integrase
VFVEQLPSGKYRGGYRHDGRKVTRTFDYRGEAEAWATAAEADAKAPTAAPVSATPAAAAVVTLAAWGADWIGRRGRLAAGTVSGYRTHLRAIAADPIGDMVVGRIQLRDVEAWHTRQLETEGVGRPTVNARTKVFRMIYRDAMAHALATADPSAGIKLLATETKPDGTLSRDAEAAALPLADDVLRAQILLAVDAGLRWSEVAGLSAANVVGDYLVITQVVEKTTRTVRAYVKGAALGHRNRVVPITPRLAAALRPLVLAAAAHPDALLFTTEDGKVLCYRNWLRRTWKPYARRAGIRGQLFHDLRHTYGSRLAAAGVPRSEIATLMGHADEETTARYIHAGEDGHRRTLVFDALVTPAERKAARKAAKAGRVLQAV